MVHYWFICKSMHVTCANRGGLTANVKLHFLGLFTSPNKQMDHSGQTDTTKRIISLLCR